MRLSFVVSCVLSLPLLGGCDTDPSHAAGAASATKRAPKKTAPKNTETKPDLKFDGVDGEAQDKDHKNWSDVSSMSNPTPSTASPSTSTLKLDGIDGESKDKGHDKEIDLLSTSFPQ
jgi:hypothetical protein